MKIIVISLGWEQEPLVDELARRGCEIYGVHYNEDYYRGVEYADMLIADPRDLETLYAYADKVKPDAVISDQCDYSQFAQACLCERLGLPGQGLDAAQISVNKYLQRLRSQETGVLVPKFALCATLEQTRAFVARHGWPVVLKPLDNRGSFGVNKVASEQDLAPAFFDALANSHSRVILAEEFIAGVHVTVDGYVFPDSGCRSLALASKLLIGTKRQVALDILYPGEIDPELYERTMRTSEEVCTKLGYCFGMTHCEYMLTEQGEIYLIEAANRGGGVYTSEIICPVVSGVDLVEQYVSDSLGETKDLFSGEPERNQVILKFFSFEPGTIKDIRGQERVHATKGVHKFRLAVAPGGIIEPITTDANRHGFVIYQSQGDIRAEVEELLNQIEVVYERPD